MDETGATSATYDRIASDYAIHWADAGLLAGQMARFAARLPAGARVLDVGCGAGRDTGQMRERGLRAAGLDRSRGMLAQARRRGIPLLLGDMRRLPVRDGALDGLWACASFLHIPRRDAPGVLLAFRRALRPGGLLYLSVKQGDGERWVEYSAGLRRFFAFYRPDEIDCLLVAAGFAVCEGWIEDDSLGRPERWINRLATAGEER